MHSMSTQIVCFSINVSLVVGLKCNFGVVSQMTIIIDVEYKLSFMREKILCFILISLSRRHFHLNQSSPPLWSASLRKDRERKHFYQNHFYHTPLRSNYQFQTKEHIFEESKPLTLKQTDKIQSVNVCRKWWFRSSFKNTMICVQFHQYLKDILHLNSPCSGRMFLMKTTLIA